MQDKDNKNFSFNVRDENTHIDSNSSEHEDFIITDYRVMGANSRRDKSKAKDDKNIHVNKTSNVNNKAHKDPYFDDELTDAKQNGLYAKANASDIDDKNIDDKTSKQSENVNTNKILKNDKDGKISSFIFNIKDKFASSKNDDNTKGDDNLHNNGAKKESLKKRLSKRFTVFSLKVAIALLSLIAIMFIYFNSVVIDKFEVQDKWVLPAMVYSRPLELYPDQRLSLKQMVYELKLLKYRESMNPQRPGEYAVNYKTDKIVLIKRPFTFPDGEEGKMSLLVDFDNNRVQKILNADTKEELGYVRMDPVLLDRINRIDPKEDRIFIGIEDVPKTLITTLIEIEDRKYYSHWGVNFFAIARAFIKNAIAGRVVEGGSTITQQLVKNYLLTSERSYVRKLKEIIIAMIMDYRYTKDEILEAYMNEIYLGQNGAAGIYGFGLASYFYFGMPVSELTQDQIALLIGLIKGPSYYDPWRKPEKALERRNTVLAVLRNRGYLSEVQFEQYASRPLGIIPRGSMNYSRTPAFMGVLKQEIKTKIEPTNPDFLSGNGIKIFTSLDPQAQLAAENAVTQELDAIEKRSGVKGLEAAMVVSSWRTAEISAVVGSRKTKFDGFNRATEGRRQIGSLVKPFVYLTSFNNGFHLGSIVQDSPLTVKLQNGRLWSPKNDDKQFRGPIRVIKGMARSLNVPTVRVGMAVGLKKVVGTLEKVGLHKDIPLYPSILLGTTELTPLELNSIYASMATDGVYQDLTSLRTIVKDGEIVYQRSDNRQTKTLDPKDTYLTLYGMTEATRSGTGRRLGAMFPGVTIGSKTGTTNNNRDTWSTGIDSDEIVTSWVGFDNNRSTGLYGSSGALMVYAKYLKLRGVNSLELRRPKGIKFVNFASNGQVLADGCNEPGMTLLPAREDMITAIKQCNVQESVDNQSLNRPEQNRSQEDANIFEKFLLGL